jgi:anti-sigma regulatory factor (Ser/Thr protein kinase)
MASREIRRELNVSSASGRLTRQALDGWLSDLVGEETAAAARLAACELVENAVRHGGLQEHDTIRLSGVATDEIVRIEVEQPSSAAGARVVAPGEREPQERGFGLRIVAAVCTKWGVRQDMPGVVWFEVDRDAT